MPKVNQKANSKKVVPLSPIKYATTKSRSLPWGKCYINDDWRLRGIATILMARVMPSGKFVVGIYLVDVFCLGLKDSGFQFAIDADQYQDMQDKTAERHESGMEAIPAVVLQNIIYGAIEYAENLGFQPHKSFQQTEYILDPADKIGYVDIEFGKDGKPYYMQGPFDNSAAIMKKLDQTVGPGNYHFLSRVDINSLDMDEQLM